MANFCHLYIVTEREARQAWTTWSAWMEERKSTCEWECHFSSLFGLAYPGVFLTYPLTTKWDSVHCKLTKPNYHQSSPRAPSILETWLLRWLNTMKCNIQGFKQAGRVSGSQKWFLQTTAQEASAGCNNSLFLEGLVKTNLVFASSIALWETCNPSERCLYLDADSAKKKKKKSPN